MYQGICIANCESNASAPPKDSISKTLAGNGLNSQLDANTVRVKNGQNISCILKLISAMKTLRN